MVPTWLHFASENPSKSSPKTDLKRLQFFHRFRHRFLNDLGSNLVPSWVPRWAYVGGQNRIKTVLDGARIRPDPLQACFLIDFFDFSSILAPLESPQINENPFVFICFFLLYGSFNIKIDLGCHFGRNLAPFCFPKSVQIFPQDPGANGVCEFLKSKTPPRWLQHALFVASCVGRFYVPFGSSFPPNLARKND